MKHADDYVKEFRAKANEHVDAAMKAHAEHASECPKCREREVELECLHERLRVFVQMNGSHSLEPHNDAGWLDGCEKCELMRGLR